MADNRPDADFDGYLRVQAVNLKALRALPHFALVEGVGALYDRSAKTLPTTVDVTLLKLFVLCHQALLSAAATIGRAQPGDSIGVTRRAVEAARLAAAFKHNPANIAEWLSEEVRLSRWKERLRGEKPSQQVRPAIVYPPKHPIVESLGRQLGILSDVGVHLTPEYFGQLRAHVLSGGTDEEPARVLFSYFAPSKAEIEDALMYLATTHMLIIDLFDECFDGAFHSDAKWGRLRQGIAARGQALSQAFQRDAEGREEEDP
jgi:hypothetical protein